MSEDFFVPFFLSLFTKSLILAFLFLWFGMGWDNADKKALFMESMGGIHLHCLVGLRFGFLFSTSCLRVGYWAEDGRSMLIWIMDGCFWINGKWMVGWHDIECNGNGMVCYVVVRTGGKYSCLGIDCVVAMWLGCILRREEGGWRKRLLMV